MKELELNDIELWNMIEKINWNEICRENDEREANDKVKDFCVENYDFDTLVKLNSFIYDKKESLKKLLKEHMNNMDSDERNEKYQEFESIDYIDDVVAHIVGLGENVYNNVSENITSIYNFKECVKSNFRFGICLAQEEIVLFS